MVDDGYRGDLGNPVGGDPGPRGIHCGDDSNSVGGDGSCTDFLKQITGGGGNASNFVSCNFYIGFPGSVCDFFVGG